MAGDKNGKTESSIYASIEVALHAPRMKKSVCVVDDADSILGTTKGFLESGETRNRVWLHNLLERPNTKVVWIVNDTRFIDDSIKRRFSYSLYFPPLQIEQKVQVWKNILKRYKAKRYMPDSEIIHWVKRYDVSVGVINLCVKMVMLGNIKNKADFLSHLEMSMESYKSLSKNTNRFTKIQRGSDHFIDSIGTSVEVSEIIADLVEFDNYLKAANRKETLPIRNRSLLFYGVPGAGKSELAKYISEKLNKPLIRKLASDILSMWVGGTEQNIRDAYQEAEIKDGVLFIDEAGFLRQSRFPYRQAPKSYSECLLSAKTLCPSPLSQKYIYHQRQNRLFRHTLPYVRLLVVRQKNSPASSPYFGLSIKRRIDLYFRDKFYPAFLVVFYLHTLLRLSLSVLLFANSIDTNKGYFG